MEVRQIEKNILNKIDEIFCDYNFMYLEIPIFERNKKETRIKREVLLGENRRVIIVPPNDEELHEFDEKIFYGILTIAALNNSKTVIADFTEIIKISGLSYNGDTTKKLKETLRKLSDTFINFENIKINNQTYTNLKTKYIDSYVDIDLSDTENVTKYKEYIKNKKVKHLAQLEIPLEVFNELSIIDVSVLAMIKGITAKKLYLLIKKSAVESGEAEEHCNISLLKLFVLMPLKIDTKNLGAMYNYIDYQFFKLKEMNIIKSYVLVNDKNIIEDYVTFAFEKNNLVNKLKTRIAVEGEKVAQKDIDDIALYDEYIKDELISLEKIMADTRDIVKNMDFNRYFYKKEIMIILYEKFHSVKAMARFIKYEDIEEEAEEICGIFEDLIKERRKYTLTINELITEKIKKMLK